MRGMGRARTGCARWFRQDAHAVGRTDAGEDVRAPAADEHAGAELPASPHTDLALEASAWARSQGIRLDGVREEREQPEEGITVTRVHVETAAAERALGKRRGRYVTIEAPGLRHRDPDFQERVSRRFAAEFADLLPVGEDASVLVVGLGNAHVTPDALGPLVVERLLVTRHLFHYMPEALGEGYRTVCAVAPGVLGVTGIETAEMVKGIVERVRPDVVIAVDALASRALSRVNATIQIADSGIQPGGGVGNHRQALDRDTLGVPCLAVGVPTVVDAATIAHDAMDLVLRHVDTVLPGDGASQLLNRFTPKEKWQLIREVLEPLGNNLMVTPKEIDAFIDDIAHVVAKGLNAALHPGVDFAGADAITH
ncbi:germination protease [Alicyclobacillus cellulosilyticus]|uniref:Germination protease n=1 Tax=Alicyclobacillus cellulosilyticus TaxID=1003997 RepID=A0A917KJ33_9BACL|nr:GPR endopeptidase [Alicyclobacillus cellulosilyticus]GGJ14218.1 germination protease [Alicyclobacillus cellulosilyticus]